MGRIHDPLLIRRKSASKFVEFRLKIRGRFSIAEERQRPYAGVRAAFVRNRHKDKKPVVPRPALAILCNFRLEHHFLIPSTSNGFFVQIALPFSLSPENNALPTASPPRPSPLPRTRRHPH